MQAVARISTLIVALFAPAAAMAEVSQQALTVQARCNEMQAKIVAEDVDGAMEFIFPRLVELIGADKMAFSLLRGAAAVKTLNATVTCAVPTQFSKVGGRLFALVPMLTTARIVHDTQGKGQLKQWSSTLAISENMGQTWTFLHVGEAGVPEALVAGGIGNIVIPPKDKGIFTPD